MDDQRTGRNGGHIRWLNRLRIASAVVCSSIFVLSVAFWIRSYYRYQAVFIKQGAIVYAVGAYGGYMCASIRPAHARSQAWQVNDWPMDKNRGVVADDAKSANMFGFGGEGYHDGVAVLLVPAWFLSLGSGLASLLLWRMKAIAFSVRNLLIATAVIAVILGIAVYPK